MHSEDAVDPKNDHDFGGKSPSMIEAGQNVYSHRSRDKDRGWRASTASSKVVRAAA